MRNALLATAGLGQAAGRLAEPPIVTGGTDFTAVRHLLGARPGAERSYSARDVIAYILGEAPHNDAAAAPAAQPQPDP